MTNRPRIVLDTNAVVSALLLKHSVAREAFDRAQALGILLISLDTLAELAEVLRREKFSKYVTEYERQQFLAAYANAAVLIEPLETIHVCGDPGDDRFLELAIAGEASFIVTGDLDLLSLNPFRNVEILRPSDFLNRFTND